MSHKRESRFRIPKFRFRILKSRKVLLVKSGILDFGIRKTAQGTWIPLMIGFRNPSFNDKESGIQYLEAGIHGLESRRRRQKTVLAFLCIGRICDCNIKNTTRVRITLLKYHTSYTSRKSTKLRMSDPTRAQVPRYTTAFWLSDHLHFLAKAFFKWNLFELNNYLSQASEDNFLCWRF